MNRIEKQLAVTGQAGAYQKAWFADLRERILTRGEPYAIMQADTPHEIFHAMDIPIVTNQWWAAVIAAKQLSPLYFDFLKEQGYHEGLCRYCSLGLAATLHNDPSIAPWGGLPKPLLLCARLTCDCVQRVFRLWGDALGAPFFPIDNPGIESPSPRWWEDGIENWESLYQPHRLDLMVGQLEELIAFAEQRTGRTFDRAHFSRMMELIDRQETVLGEADRLIAEAPKCPVRVAEQMTNTMTAQWHRGTEWGLAHATAFRDEVRARVDAGIAAVPNERKRLMWIGAGLWHDTSFYSAFEESHGAVFTWSMYLPFAFAGYVRRPLTDPMRALASRVASMNEQLHNPPWINSWLVHEAQRNRIDGALVLMPKSCHPAAASSKFIARDLEAAGVPVLEIWTDMVDSRDWDGPAMQARVATFLEERLG
ncbi:2-hydroxyacyl-CoA dehydratase subunit D [Roseiterribacter gracilis]|uniref:2-hydroxyglutaryl-CoA dehydratase n=1 Tax=Roseiterribacter gracilis TaxID=2812848 RepID=A0A8S8XKD8_9PROT|nr:2-hydroxyglutaryl-CoA dehydratase [Rhodospirillales bacterium TMPK1]